MRAESRHAEQVLPSVPSSSGKPFNHAGGGRGGKRLLSPHHRGSPSTGARGPDRGQDDPPGLLSPHHRGSPSTLHAPGGSRDGGHVHVPSVPSSSGKPFNATCPTGTAGVPPNCTPVATPKRGFCSPSVPSSSGKPFNGWGATSSTRCAFCPLIIGEALQHTRYSQFPSLRKVSFCPLIIGEALQRYLRHCRDHSQPSVPSSSGKPFNESELLPTEWMPVAFCPLIIGEALQQRPSEAQARCGFPRRV